MWLYNKYTHPIFAEGLDFAPECPGYDNKQSDGEAFVML